MRMRRSAAASKSPVESTARASTAGGKGEGVKEWERGRGRRGRGTEGGGREGESERECAGEIERRRSRVGERGETEGDERGGMYAANMYALEKERGAKGGGRDRDRKRQERGCEVRRRVKGRARGAREGRP